jgi:ABC-type branched-subunit amino acid transport system ATPase component
MGLKFKNTTLRNFLSVGNATQAVSFDRTDLTLVLGLNLDLGGDEQGARNGVGKSTLMNAISYALYGEAITTIKRDNLVNHTNNKNMLVSLEFEVGDKQYRIERGRKPTVLRLFENGSQKTYKEESSAQGDSRETQKDIDAIVGISHDMFKHIVTLNTYTEPFLKQKSGDQRTLIEQLLGITLLSDKADALREQIKNVKAEIKGEEIRIKAVQDANTRIQEQIDSLKRRQITWATKLQTDVVAFEQNIARMSKIDIEKELENHKLLLEYTESKKKIDDANKWIASLTDKVAKENRMQAKIIKEIEDLESHKCYACGQTLHEQNMESLLAAKGKLLEDSIAQVAKDQDVLNEYTAESHNLQLTLVAPPKTNYRTANEAMNHKNTLESTIKQLEAKQLEEDPYAEQIVDMENKALETVTWDKINECTQLIEHQEFLLKLLTNKDSFIRKKIIDQNLSYLNQRLTHYLTALGLPHTVRFLSDLSVEIQELGRELDYGNLSRGESNRLTFSLSLAFRDVWESLYEPINLLFIDEMIDMGLDASGVEAAVHVLKKISRERNKCIFLISHKDELSSRVNNIMTVTKENGFTHYH